MTDHAEIQQTMVTLLKRAGEQTRSPVAVKRAHWCTQFSREPGADDNQTNQVTG